MTPGEPVIRATYRLSAHNLYGARAAHAGWSQRLIQIFGAFLILFGLLGLIARPHSQIWLPIVIGVVLIFRLRIASALSRDRQSRMETEMTASDAGIDLRVEDTISRFEWPMFLRYTETNDLFLLYTRPNVFHLVPKRALAAGDLQPFSDLLRNKLGERSAAYSKRAAPKTAAFLAVIAIAITLLLWVLGRQMH